MQSTHRPFFLFTTPRAGSWPVYSIFLKYFEAQRHIQGLGEIFTLDYHSMWWENDKLIERPFAHPLKAEDIKRRSNSKGAREIYSRVLDFRKHLIESSPEKYFFKIFSNHMSPEHALWFLQKFEWIFLERKNLFEQLLSFLISLHMNQWYEAEGIKIAPCSLQATEKQVKAFEAIIWRYHHYKLMVKPRYIITYEDFCDHEPPELLKRLNFKEDWDFRALSLPRKQNLAPKGDAFKNLGQIKEWYKATFMNRLFFLNELR